MSSVRALNQTGRAALLAALLSATPLFAVAQQAQDKAAERRLRQQQAQVQTLQQQVQEAQAAKAKADADKARLDTEKAAVEGKLAKQAKEIPRTQVALRKASDDLKAANTANAELQAQIVALEKQLVETRRLSEATHAAKDRALAQALKIRDTELAEVQGRGDASAKQVLECSDKNQRLVKLNAEVLDRYRKKGVGDVLAQREPLFGFSDVQMFNLVQDYRDKADAERYSPPNQTSSR